ncbi:hypothetical protein SD427_15705 [Chryseobacterium sp. JJR-5R]|uniref:hypothetical protein n=1 Tax=Chryseobacterium sp. JJR-5R TaxID=3093923 RepID=UPI002A75E9C1|nr:hypothetical protein [Chryseobacterium sp. JJR-5R]WPO82200.1 hypothetical protein SD427_15705 [Chryseobacterium sp. JJR-5R]
MKNIQIPNACSENWRIMSLQEKGRFCSACSKCVIDFSDKHPEEIQQISLKKEMRMKPSAEDSISINCIVVISLSS